jgi:hypothetical protein
VRRVRLHPGHGGAGRGRADAHAAAVRAEAIESCAKPMFDAWPEPDAGAASWSGDRDEVPTGVALRGNRRSAPTAGATRRAILFRLPAPALAPDA